MRKSTTLPRSPSVALTLYPSICFRLRSTRTPHVRLLGSCEPRPATRRDDAPRGAVGWRLHGKVTAGCVPVLETVLDRRRDGANAVGLGRSDHRGGKKRNAAPAS